MPEKHKGGVACLCCARPLSKWHFCFINRQAIGFIRSLLYVLESYLLRGYILGLGVPVTNAVGASGAINGMKR